MSLVTSVVWPGQVRIDNKMFYGVDLLMRPTVQQSRP